MKKLMRSSSATSLSCLYDSIQSSTTDCRKVGIDWCKIQKKWMESTMTEKHLIKSGHLKILPFIPALHSCPASPPQTASCFPCHSLGGGHLTGQLPSLLCLSPRRPSSPSSHPETPQKNKRINKCVRLITVIKRRTISFYTTKISMKAIRNGQHAVLFDQNVLTQGKCVKQLVPFHTFPFAESVTLPSGSSEKSVSEENRVSVSLVDTRRH